MEAGLTKDIWEIEDIVRLVNPTKKANWAK
jgi:hypothetical protein